MENKPTIKIRNDATGEVKEIVIDQAQEFGIDPKIALERYKSQLAVQKAVEDSNKPKFPEGADAVAIAMQQGGGDFINKGKDVGSRNAIAETIARMGGVTKYRDQLPLNDLLTQPERDQELATQNLQSAVDTALPNFKKDTLGGTGPLAQFIPSFLRSQAGQDKIANASRVQSLYAQLVSGKVISEPEMQRLSGFLPTAGKNESVNKRDLERLSTGIVNNMKLFEKGKREGLTPNEAYTKYGKDIIGTDGTRVKNKSGNSKYSIESVK